MFKSAAACETTSLGAVILVRLNELGKNQTWLAEQCHVTRGQISHIVTGRSHPSLKLFVALAYVLNIDNGILMQSIDL